MKLSRTCLPIYIMSQLEPHSPSHLFHSKQMKYSMYVIMISVRAHVCVCVCECVCAHTQVCVPASGGQAILQTHGVICHEELTMTKWPEILFISFCTVQIAICLKFHSVFMTGKQKIESCAANFRGCGERQEPTAC